MAESRRGLGLVLVATGLLLAAACWFDIGSAAASALFAQGPTALGIALLRGTRGKTGLGRDALSLTLLWAGGFLCAGLLVAWPLQALRASPGLLPTLAMSSACAVLLLLLWRHWPLWHGLEREGGGIRARHALQDAHERSAWSGLQVAVPVLLLLGGGIALGWPGLLESMSKPGTAISIYCLPSGPCTGHSCALGRPKTALKMVLSACRISTLICSLSLKIGNSGVSTVGCCWAGGQLFRP